jgi:hypothetical protein
VREGVRPGLYLYGSGGGRVVADPRTIRSLVEKGLAFRPSLIGSVQLPYRVGKWRNMAYLTRACFALVGAEPPAKHPYKADEEWP